VKVNQEQFKRTLFFQGFFPQETDFNNAVDYDVEKRKLHNRMFHSPGVVDNYRGGLRVTPRGKAGLSVEVAPGYAIDGQGNDIFLNDVQVKTLEPEKLKIPAEGDTTVYLTLRFVEEKADFIVYKENPQFKGHTRMEEKSKIDFSSREPDASSEIELCRVVVNKDVTSLSAARNPLEPGPGELDRRFVPRAGVVGSFLHPKAHFAMVHTLKELREVLKTLGLRYNLFTAREARNGVTMGQVLAVANHLDLSSALSMFQMLADLQGDMILEMEEHDEIRVKERFNDFKAVIEALKKIVEETSTDPHAMLLNILSHQKRATDALVALLPKAAEKKRPRVTPTVKEEEPEIDLDEEWKKVVAAQTGDDLDLQLTVGKVKYTMVDRFDVGDQGSEKEHGFAISGASKENRARGTFRYPDGNRVADVGAYHTGGESSWTVKGLKPGRSLVMVKRFDFAVGNIQTEIQVNDESVGRWDVSGNDTRNRWRNAHFTIDASKIAADTIKITQKLVDTNRGDINMYRFWFYQQLD
jgi:hypothetical protein